MYFTSDRLLGAVRPLLQLNPSDQKEAQYVIAPVDDFTNSQIVGDVGGPVVRDRLWFRAGYNPQQTVTHRTVTFKSNGQTATFDSKPLDRIFNYNLTGQATTNLRLRLAGSIERAQGATALPSIQTDGTSTSNPALFPATVHYEGFNNATSGGVDWVVSSRTFVNVTAGYLTYGGHDVGAISNALQHVFAGSNFQFSDIPADLQHVSRHGAD